MAFGNTEERLSQFGNKRQILNAIREHYLMKREADHGSQLFWDRIFQLWACRVSPLQGSCCQAVKMAEGSGEPCAAAVCAPGALHRHLRSLRTRALVALSWPGPSPGLTFLYLCPEPPLPRRQSQRLVRTLPAKRLSFAIIATRCAAKKVPAKARLPSARAACLLALRSD